MSLASDLQDQRTELAALRATAERTRASMLDFRTLHSSLSKHIDRLARGAASQRSDEALAAQLNRVLRRRATGEGRLEALKDAASGGARDFGDELSRGLASLTDQRDVTVAGHGRFPSVPVDAGLDEHLGIDAEALESWTSHEFSEPSHPFMTVLTAALREDGTDEEIREAVVNAYRRDADDVESAQRASRGLLGVVGMLRERADALRKAIDRVRSEHVRTLDEAREQDLRPLELLGWEDPVALLPIRLETRFTEDGSRLQVRVYPEQIHVDTHEPGLTEEEWAWGTEFWIQLWFAGLPMNASDPLPDRPVDLYRDPASLPDMATQEESDRLKLVVHELFEQYGSSFSPDPGLRFDEIRDRAWARGSERFGGTRAAYVVHALTPRGTLDDLSRATLREGRRGRERFGFGRGFPFPDLSTRDRIAELLASMRRRQQLGRRLLAGWVDSESPLESVVQIEFPDPDLRPESWTQTPRARLLPDRFVGYAYYPADDDRDETTPWSDRPDGSEHRREGREHVIRFFGEPVREPLPLGPSPEAVGEGDRDPSLDWMVDFQEAKRAGMALSVDLPSDTAWVSVREFTRVIVIGVRTSLDPTEAAKALERQIDAAHYTTGVELLAPGTPTNNADVPAGYTNRPALAQEARVEVEAPLARPGGDGVRLARALGINAEPFGHVAGAGDTLETDAGDMNTVLWPATIGYFAANLWVAAGSQVRLDNGGPGSGELDAERLKWLESYRDHFVRFVRADGPYPALRVGRQPYGILPVTPLGVTGDELTRLDRPVPADEPRDFTYGTIPLFGDPELLPEIVRRLESLSSIWSESSETVASVGRSAAMSDEEFLEMLSQEAVARRYARRVWLLDPTHPLFTVLGLPGLTADQRADVVEALKDAGIDPPWTPRITQMIHLGFTLDGRETKVSDDPGPFLDLLNALLPLADNVSLVRLLGTTEWDDTLVKQVLRLSVVQAALSARLRIGAAYNEPGNLPPEPPEYPLARSTFRPPIDSLFDALEDTIPTGSPAGSGVELSHHPAVNGPVTYGELLRFIAKDVRDGLDPSESPDPVFARQLAALRRLAAREPARVDRLFRGTLDLASHRLDAWWTSLATRQLHRVRSGASAAENGAGGRGLHIGAFGFVENLSAGSGPEAEYLLAPSQDQAVTASVLRTAHKSRVHEQDPAAESLAIDLSSDRVRRARALLRGVRRGLTLGELLGYRFERSLKEESGDSQDLETYIHDFRILAPAIEGQLDRGEIDAETRKSDVVDGLALHRLWKQGTLYDELDAALADSGRDPDGGLRPAERAAVDGILADIDVALDAVHDVLMSEGVHQLTHGRPDRAAAALEALSRGAPAPELQVLESPRTETSVTHRLAVLFPDGSSPPVPHGWPRRDPDLLTSADLPGATNGGESSGPDRPRATAEPNLDGWVGTLLPAPTRVGCRGVFQWSRERSFFVGSFQVPREPGVVTVDGLGFEPDLIEFAVAPNVESNGITRTPSSVWSHGLYRSRAGELADRQVAVFGAIDADGSSLAGSTDRACLFLEIPGTSGPAQLVGTVEGTTTDGFELRFDIVEAASAGVVHFRARRVADPTSVRIGLVSVPSTPSRVAVDLSEGLGDDFDPDHVVFTSLFARGAPGGIGFSTGDICRDDSGTSQRVVGSSTGTVAAANRAVARDDAVVHVVGGTDTGDGMEASVAAFPSAAAEIELDFDAPFATSYAPGDVLFMAFESPVSDGEGSGPVVHRTAVGKVSAATTDGENVFVDLGFRPGLVEFVVAGSLTDEEDGFPFETTPGLAEASLSHGWASGIVHQGATATAPAQSGFLSTTLDHRVAALMAESTEGELVERTAIRLSKISDDGFELEFSRLDDVPQDLLVFYRATPADPSEQGFAVATSVQLADLDLGPLDAVALTQRASEAGDSQLERRVGYHAFRHAPDHRPPVPPDAQLELAFREPGDGTDVSIAEFVEMAASVRDVLGESRPVDARDLVHPGEASHPGFTDQTIQALEDRADGVAGAAGAAKSLLQDRIKLLSPPGDAANVCEQVDELVDSLDAAVRAVPLRQIVDVCARLDREHPDGSTGRIRGTVLEELREIADRLRAGPTDGEQEWVDVVIPPASRESVSVATAFPPGTTVDVLVRSYSDAVHFPPQAATTTVDDHGAVAVPFDSNGIPVGAIFTVAVTGSGASRESLSDLLIRLMEQESPRTWPRVFDALERAGLVSPHDRQVVADFENAPVELRRHVWSALPRRGKLTALELIGREDLAGRWVGIPRTLGELVVDAVFSVAVADQVGVLERLRSSGHLDRLQLRLAARYERLDREGRDHLWTSLSKEGRLATLDALGRASVADRFRHARDTTRLFVGRIDEESSGEGPTELQQYLATEARFVPSLLWLHRVSSVFVDGKVADLESAVDGSDRDVIKDELSLMDGVPGLLPTNPSEPSVLTERQTRGLEALRDLLVLNATPLASRIREACEPLIWSGLTALIAVNGNRFRPSSQRYWRSSPAVLDTIGDKPVEGEVRSRLERALDLPDFDAPAILGGYSWPFRQFARRSRIPKRAVGDLEALLRDPAATARALGGHLSDPVGFVHDLHDVLHHIDSYLRDRTAEDLRDHIDELRRAVHRSGSAIQRLLRRLGAGDALLGSIDEIAGGLPRAVQDYAVSGPPDRNRLLRSVLDALDVRMARLAGHADAQIGGVLLHAASFRGIGRSFRAGVLEGLRQGMLRTSYLGVYGSVPASASGGTPDDERTLLRQAEAVLKELDGRIARASEVQQDQASEGATVEGQVSRIHHLLGSDFTVLPPFEPLNRGELRAIFSDQDRWLGDDHYAPDTWLLRISRIREKPEAYRQLRTYSDALGFEASNGRSGQLQRTLTVGQLPQGPGPWLGRDGVRPTGGEVCFGVELVSRQSGLLPFAALPSGNGPELSVGLFVDEWVESVPSAAETIGLGIQYDDPSTRAPQTVILAVPPWWHKVEGEGLVYAGPAGWTHASLRRTILETMEWMRRRTIDESRLQDLSHVLPALYFPYNVATRGEAAVRIPDAASVSFNDLDW